MESVGVCEGAGGALPVWIRRRCLTLAQTCCDRVEVLLGFQVEHEQRLLVRLGRRKISTGSELEVRSRPRNIKENAVITVMVGEPAELWKSDAISIERHHFLEPIGVACNA